MVCIVALTQLLPAEQLFFLTIDAQISGHNCSPGPRVVFFSSLVSAAIDAPFFISFLAGSTHGEYTSVSTPVLLSWLNAIRKSHWYQLQE